MNQCVSVMGKYRHRLSFGDLGFGSLSVGADFLSWAQSSQLTFPFYR